METSLDIRKILGFLTDEERFKVAAAVSLGADTVEKIAAMTGYDNPAILKAIVKLEAAGLIEKKEAKGYIFDIDKLKALPKALGDNIPKKARASGLERFIRDGKLITYPKDYDDRMAVLNYLAGLFELDREYTEKAVNEKLTAVHKDFASLRRYLIDNGFFKRELRTVEGGRSVTIYQRIERK